MKTGVIVFPGSNCDVDVYDLFKEVLGLPVEYVWHTRESFDDIDLVVLPGGFSYGDYLRPGAIASHSPVMRAVLEHACRGGLVLGICNGFQVLTEAGILPGALCCNENLQFRCVYTRLRVENSKTPYTCLAKKGNLLKIPVANGDGRYYLDQETLRRMEEKGQVVFRYSNEKGEVDPEADPSGSTDCIAGVCNEAGNVLGMMPHTERAGRMLTGGEDGLVLFHSLVEFWKTRKG